MQNNKDFTDQERDDLAAEPEMVINTTSPKAKGFNFKIIMAILMGLVLVIFIILQFNVLGKKAKTVEEIEKENNAKIETATSQAMQGVDSVNRLPASYQNPNSLQSTNSTTGETGPLNNQELIAAQQKAMTQNPNGQVQGQVNPYNNQQSYNQNGNSSQPSLPAPSPEQQAMFEDKRRLQQLHETKAQQQETEERERIRAIMQERKQALTSSIKFNISGRSTASTTNQNTSDGAKPAPMPQTPNFQMPDLGLGGSDINKQKDKQAYLDAERNTPNYLKANMNYPVSPYQIMAGAIIPASFITGLNSDLPGQIIGQVRENVYDSVRGRHLLIPQSTRIIGEYSSGVTFGQDRILIVWTRLIFPNGTSINLEGMPGVDLSGYAGSADKVNHHFFKIATGAIFSSVLGAGVKIAAGNQTAGAADFAQMAASGAAESIGKAGDKLLSKMIDQQSTIIIRPGTKFNVFVNKDIILRPFKH
jgi:type IV secretion system protein VirB10